MSDGRKVTSEGERRPIRPGVWAGFLVAGVLLVASAAVLIVRSGPEPVSVGEVVRAIRETVLAGHHTPDDARAGVIGPWQVAAESFDAGTSTFHRFRLETDTMMASAETARLSIDVESASFTFHLRDVRIVTLPMDLSDQAAESSVAMLDEYELGPVPLRSTVILDPSRPRRMPVVTPAETVRDQERRASVFDELH